MTGAALENGFGRGQRRRVHAHRLLGRAHHGLGGEVVVGADRNRVGEVILALGVGIADAGEQADHVGHAKSDGTGSAKADLALNLARILVLADGRDPARGIDNETSVAVGSAARRRALAMFARHKEPKSPAQSGAPQGSVGEDDRHRPGDASIRARGQNRVAVAACTAARELDVRSHARRIGSHVSDPGPTRGPWTATADQTAQGGASMSANERVQHFGRSERIAHPLRRQETAGRAIGIGSLVCSCFHHEPAPNDRGRNATCVPQG